MTTVGPTPVGIVREAKQEKRSSWKVALTLIYSPTGRRIFNRAYMVGLLSFGLFSGLQIGYDTAAKGARIEITEAIQARDDISTEIQTNRNLSIKNRCVSIAVLIAIEAPDYSMPDWCADTIADLKSGKYPE